MEYLQLNKNELLFLVKDLNVGMGSTMPEEVCVRHPYPHGCYVI